MIYDRVLTVYSLSDGGSPLDRRLTGPAQYYYGERTVGVTRFYQALMAGSQVDLVLELWRADIDARQIVIPEDGQQYRVQQIQQTEDGAGLPITVLSLRRLETLYGFVSA